MSEEAKQQTPAYATYKSFINLINDLRDGPIPPHIEYSVVKGSNSGKATMLASLKALDLIDGEKCPSDLFKSLVREKENYKKNLQTVLENAYPYLFDGTIDLTNTTTEQVAERFKSAGARGSTVSKAMSFFISAAKEAGIGVSARVKPPQPARSSNSSRRGRNGNNTESNSGDTPLVNNATQPSEGESRSVELSSGGTLTISASTGWLSLSTEDRDFVFGLIDKLAEYEQSKSKNDVNENGEL